jgi:hypothetical protein
MHKHHVSNCRLDLPELQVVAATNELGTAAAACNRFVQL